MMGVGLVLISLKLVFRRDGIDFPAGRHRRADPPK
jgi:hypothetical protein